MKLIFSVLISFVLTQIICLLFPSFILNLLKVWIRLIVKTAPREFRNEILEEITGHIDEEFTQLITDKGYDRSSAALLTLRRCWDLFFKTMNLSSNKRKFIRAREERDKYFKELFEEFDRKKSFLEDLIMTKDNFINPYKNIDDNPYFVRPDIYFKRLEEELTKDISDIRDRFHKLN